MQLTKKDLRDAFISFDKTLDKKLDKKFQQFSKKLDKRIDKKLEIQTNKLTQVIEDKVDDLARITASGFDEVHEQLTILTVRVDRQGHTMDHVECRLGTVETRLDEIETAQKET